MTSWPWMKNCNNSNNSNHNHSLGHQAFADPPIAPVCDEDNRPAVRDLIATHRSAIDKLARDLFSVNNKLYNNHKHDDVWILRFVLSHKGHHQHALDAAERTLHFRAQHNLDAHDIRPYPPGPLAQDESFQRYFKCIKDPEAFQFEIPHPQRGVVVFLKAPGFDQSQLQQLDGQDHVQAFAYINEWTHQWLDYVTRTTGRLTKSARLFDVKGVPLRHINYEAIRLEAKAISAMQDYYPQLLDCLYVCDPPVWAHIPWKMVRPLLPSRVVHKIDFVKPGKSKQERKRLRAHLQEEHLPVVYGGQRSVSSSWTEPTNHVNV